MWEGLQNQQKHHIILTKNETVRPTAVFKNYFWSGMLKLLIKVQTVDLFWEKLFAEKLTQNISKGTKYRICKIDYIKRLNKNDYIERLNKNVTKLIFLPLIYPNKKSVKWKAVTFGKLISEMNFRWESVEQESGVQLVYKTGGVNWAKKEEMGYLIDKYAEAMDTHNIRSYHFKFSEKNVNEFPLTSVLNSNADHRLHKYKTSLAF